MPTRILRDWTDSEAVNALSPGAEVLFVRLIQKADDFGRYTANPKLLRPNLFPLRLDSVRETDLDRWIAECVKASLVRLYEVEGKRYLVIEKFGQRLKRKSDGSLLVKPKYPAPPGKSWDWMPDSGHFPEVPGSSGKCLLEAESYSESETKAKASAEPVDGGSAPEPPARAERGPRMVPPTEEEWVAYARATWPEWPEHDIRGSWAHYEKTRWKGVSVWKACAKTCFHQYAGRRDLQQARTVARALVGAHRPVPARAPGRAVDEESPLWVIGVYKALMHPARPVVPDDLEEAWERWRGGEEWNGREPNRWRERLEAAVASAVVEDARMAVGKGGGR